MQGCYGNALFPNKDHRDVHDRSTMDGKLLFSFDFLVERLTFVDIECAFPGVTFNLLDFPLVLVEPPVRSLQHHYHMDSGENERCMTVKFNRGKSCHFEMKLKDLVESLRKSAVQVALVDLVKNNSNVPKVLGTAVLDLSDTANSLQKPAIENGQYSAGERQEIAILEASNKKIVAKAHIRWQFKTSLTHQENMRAGFEETSVTIPIYTQNGHESRLCKGVSTTAVLQPLSGPNQHSSSVNESHLYDIEHMATTFSPAGKDPSSMSESHLSPEVESLNNDCELLYLPNSVCPPPLFYQHQPRPNTEPSNHGVGEWVHETSGDLFVGNDTAMDHWSVLMAHDHCSHPVTVKQNATENTMSSQELPSKQIAALPLLSALMEELLLLKSHTESTPPLEVAAPLFHRREPETATKCLQTDESLTMSISQPAKKKSLTARVVLSPQPTGNAHHRHTRFVRECCIQKRANSSTTQVPRNKSVIYPPDVVHKRQKAVGLRNKHTWFGMHKEGARGAKSKVAKLVPKRKQVSSPLQNEEKSEMLSSLNSDQGEVRKVEVFIPQATYVAGSTEDSPLSGSVASLHKVHVDAETQTAMTDSLQFEPSKDQFQTEHVRPSDVVSPSLSQKSTVQSDDMNRDPKSGNVEVNTESLASQTDCHSNTQEAKQDISLQPSGVSIMITHAYKDGSPSQKCASPNVVVQRRASIGFPMGSKQNNSLLNIAASQTLDSFLSVDSLDIADSTVLPKHTKEGFVYLASSQSSGSHHDLAADEHDSDHSYTEEYSDDFEELESSSSTSSSSSNT